MKWETIGTLEECTAVLKNVFDRDFTYVGDRVEITFASHKEAADAILKARLAVAMMESKCS